MRKGLAIIVCSLVLGVFFIQAGTAQAQNKSKTIVFKNDPANKNVAQVNINFGAESQVTKNDFLSICNMRGTPSNLNCGFDLKPGESKTFDPKGKQMNFAVAFNKVVDCGATKGEASINMNKPDPNTHKPMQDTFDVSVVDGFNEKITATYDPAPNTPAKKVVLGPPCGLDNNQRAYGVFPYGCTICAGGRTKANKRCGYSDNDTLNCKSGTEKNPGVLCQYNFNDNTEAKGTITFVIVPQNTPCQNK